MTESVNRQIRKIDNIIISYGDKFSVELKPRLVTVGGETRWVVEASGVEKATPAQFIKRGMTELSSKIIPIGNSTMRNHERNFILHTAKTTAEAESARRWVKDFVKSKSEAYLEDKGFLRNDVSKRLKSLSVNNGYEKINNIISIGIQNNESPHHIRSRIREDVFGLKKGKRNKGLTSHAEMIMRTELSYAERNVNREVMRQDDEKIGVQLHFYGGPCPSGICPAIISSGHNVRVSGDEMTADFYFDTGVPWPPYHPRCHCGLLRYLYKRDLEKREGGGEIPAKFKEKIFIEEKGLGKFSSFIPNPKELLSKKELEDMTYREAGRRRKKAMETINKDLEDYKKINRITAVNSGDMVVALRGEKADNPVIFKVRNVIKTKPGVVHELEADSFLSPDLKFIKTDVKTDFDSKWKRRVPLINSYVVDDTFVKKFDKVMKKIRRKDF